MKKTLFAAIAALCGLATTLPQSAHAQLDLGGAISGAVNGATGAAGGAAGTAQSATQAAAQSAGGAAAQTGARAGAQLNAGSALSAPSIGSQSGANTGLNAGAGLNTGNGAGIGANVNGGLNSGLGGGLNNGLGGGVNSGLSGGVNNGLSGGVNTGAQTGGSQGWLGRMGDDLRGAFQQADSGVLQFQNNLNSNLQQHGFRAGDQLLGANGQPLTQAQLDQYLQSNPNQVRVLRNGQTITLGGNASGYAQGGVNQSGQMQSSMGGRQRLGITMNPSGNAVVVAAVTQGSPAAAAGLRTGDQIVSVNGQQVQNPNDMIQLVNQSEANQALNIQYQRNGQTMQSQVMLASGANMNRNGAYQAGYAQPMNGQSSGQASGQGSAQLSADVTARIDQLERTVQDLRDEIRRLSDSKDK